MGHLKVKKIEIKDNKVYMLAADSNVLPLDYEYKEYPNLTEKLQKGGNEMLDFAILREYEQGWFQHHSENLIANPQNKYSKAMFLLKQQDIYKKIDWRLRNYSTVLCPVQKVRESEEYKKILLSALKLKPTKGRFVIKLITGKYLIRDTKLKTVSSYEISEAKVFKTKEDAIYRASTLHSVIELTNS